MKHSDLIVVGAGIMGLAHAYYAACAGMSVRVFDRSPSAQGASIRNFGMLAAIAQSQGQQLEDALRALKSWQNIGSEAGFEVIQSGCLVLAKHPEELAVLQEFANTDRASSSSKLLEPSQLAQYGSELRVKNLLGALWSEEAWKVDQRQAMNKITHWLERKHDVTFHFSSNVSEISMPIVQTSTGSYSSDAVIVCAGNEFSTLFPDSFKDSGVTQCELQMLRTAKLPDWQLQPFILGGLSLPRYASFSQCSSLADLKSMQQTRYRKHIEHGIHIVACQEADGSMTIGDSHAYTDEANTERSSEIDRLIMDELNSLIAIPQTQVTQRWCGRYAHLPGTDVLKLSPANGVMAVTATHGQGMTHAFAIAEDVIHGISNS